MNPVSYADVPARDAAIAACLERGVSLRVICGLFDLLPGTVHRIADEAGCSLPVEAPGPLTIYSTRNAEMVRRALAGEDFSAISKSYGLSRERVRQVVREVTGLSGRDLGDVRLATREAVKEQLARDIAATEPESSSVEIANRAGITTARVEALLGPAQAARRRKDRVVTDATAEEASLEALRKVAALAKGRPLSGPFFDAHRGGTLTSTRIIQVFGTWTAACHRAGVEPHSSVRSDYTQRWNRVDCLKWVAAYLETTDRPSFARFDVWARHQDGAPSAGTVRLRCGKWLETTRAAADYVKGAAD